MSAMVGSKAMSESGIHSPADLLKFPWEKVQANVPTADEVSELQELMRNINSESPHEV